MPNNRRESINDTIQARGEIKLVELEREYPEVSSMTLRRDLEALERQGRIIRIRGGAKSIAHLSMIKEAVYTQRQVSNTPAKQRIAEKAAGLIASGRSIYIDSGTTCMTLAQRVPDQNLFVLTPAPNIAIELAKNANVKVNLTGGQLNRDTLTLSGFNATEYVRSINIDMAFMAASAFSIQNGFTCGDYYEAELKRLIIKKAQQVIMLVDSSKINIGMPYTFARLNQIQTLITDNILPDEYVKAIRQSRVVLL
jgi:DeoR/GlpR family transcriptional regulator of sugar metabolism